MDPGTALAVTGLTIQLSEIILKLHSLIRSIQDAPDYINTVLQDLDFIRFTLAQIASHQEKFGQDQGTELALEKCREPFHALELIADSILPGLKSDSRIKRKWAAIEVAWRQEDITKFRKKLQEAKQDLVLAFQVSSVRTLHLQNGLNHESILCIMKEAFSAQNPSFVGAQYEFSDRQTEHHAKEISQEILQSSAIHLYDSLQNELKKELRSVIQDTLASVLQEMDRGAKTSDDLEAPVLAVDKFCHRSKRRQNCIETHTVTRTMFGDIHCSTAVPRITPLDDEESELRNSSSLLEKKEVTFNFVPSWWLVKLGLSRAIQISTWGWQANIRMPKVRPSTSLIFEFCREGNVSAVKRMLSNGEASIDDVTEYGETPLHDTVTLIYAPYFLTTGLTVMRETLSDAGGRLQITLVSIVLILVFLAISRPFNLVFEPGIGIPVNPEPRQRLPPIAGKTSNSQVIATMREFLRRGQDLADISFSELILFLSREESIGHQPQTEIDPSDWLLCDAIPALGTCDLDASWWESFLMISASFCFKRLKLLQILKHCRPPTVKSAFLKLISSNYEFNKIKSSSYQQHFDIFAEHSGGVCFLHGVGQKTLSPLSNAMKHRWSFVRFRTWLRKSRWTPIDTFQNETELERLGWTEETILSLFSEDVVPWTQEFPEWDMGLPQCRDCACSPSSVDGFWDNPWLMKLRRIRDNIPLSSPLSDEEVSREAAWLAAKQAEASGICFWCFCVTNKKKWPFLSNIRVSRIWFP